MAFPATRMRRLRATGALRGLIRETELTPAHLIYPMFVELGTESRSPIESMPGIDRMSINTAVEEAGEVYVMLLELVIPAGVDIGESIRAVGRDQGVDVSLRELEQDAL